MKIEKLNDNQIRCTLDQSDLSKRHLKISELAYGSDKAKELFKDMMQQASYELGFEAENIPLMIEAIPVSDNSIVLVITKVDDPDELDARFSKFSPVGDDYDDLIDDSDDDADDSDDEYDVYDDEYDDSDDIDDSSSHTFSKKPADNYKLENLDADTQSDELLGLFNKVADYLKKSVSEEPTAKAPDFVPFKDSLAKSTKDSQKPVTLPEASSSDKPESPASQKVHRIIRIFTFDSLDIISAAASSYQNIYNGPNSLYHDPVSNKFYLIIDNCAKPSKEFVKLCNHLSEFGHKEEASIARVSYCMEHMEPYIKDSALQTIAKYQF